MDVVQTKSLTKRYGELTALRRLNLRVPAGRLFGFLGPNGAGKTTALRILLGLLRATSGRARVLGRDVWERGPRIRREVGYLPGDVRFWDNRTGRATLAFLNSARGGGAGAGIRRLTRALDLDLNRRVRDYSRGMKQKLGLIAAMMHEPRLLILDEPTTALDPLIRTVLYTELRRFVADGHTVLFSSHTLSEVEELCDEVAILRDGQLVEQQPMDVLRQRAPRRVEVSLRADAEPPTSFPKGLSITEQTESRLAGAWTGPTERLLAWLTTCPVRDVTIAPPNLDDLFLEYYSRTEGGTAE